MNRRSTNRPPSVGAPPGGASPGGTGAASAIDAWDRWQASVTDRLLALDERATTLADSARRDQLAPLFLARTALAERIQAIIGADHGNDRAAAERLAGSPVVDAVGTSVGTSLADAAMNVESQLTAIDRGLAEVERSALADAEASVSAAADLQVAATLAESLGSEVRLVSTLTERLRSRDRLPELAVDATALRLRLERMDRERSAVVAQLAGVDEQLDRLRHRQAVVEELAHRCRTKIAEPPRLAIPRVDAVGEPPKADSSTPWTAVRSRVTTYVATLQRLAEAFDEAERRFAAPLDERDQLRGLLQAFRDKAAACARAESADLQRVYRAAADLLWSAPCDLAAARAAVQRYIEAVNDQPSPTAGGVQR